jgi:hypothetical protein
VKLPQSSSTAGQRAAEILRRDTTGGTERTGAGSAASWPADTSKSGSSESGPRPHPGIARPRESPAGLAGFDGGGQDGRQLVDRRSGGRRVGDKDGIILTLLASGQSPEPEVPGLDALIPSFVLGCGGVHQFRCQRTTSAHSLGYRGFQSLLPSVGRRVGCTGPCPAPISHFRPLCPYDWTNYLTRVRVGHRRL